jgi:hypothetical protein
VPATDTKNSLPLVRTASRRSITSMIFCTALATAAVFFYSRGGPVWLTLYLALLTAMVLGLVRTLRYRLEIGAYNVELWVRRANVIVHVNYTAKRPGAQMTAEAQALARRALGAGPD